MSLLNESLYGLKSEQNVLRITLGFGNTERTIIKHNVASILSNDTYYLSHSFLINLGYEL